MAKRPLQESVVEGESLIMNPKKEDNIDDVKIKRGKVDSLSLYEVTDSELQVLEEGGQDNLFLNFAVFLFTYCPDQIRSEGVKKFITNSFSDFNKQ